MARSVGPRARVRSLAGCSIREINHVAIPMPAQKSELMMVSRQPFGPHITGWAKAHAQLDMIYISPVVPLGPFNNYRSLGYIRSHRLDRSPAEDIVYDRAV